MPISASGGDSGVDLVVVAVKRHAASFLFPEGSSWSHDACLACHLSTVVKKCYSMISCGNKVTTSCESLIVLTYDPCVPSDVPPLRSVEHAG